jgi:hypothetical protein
MEIAARRMDLSTAAELETEIAAQRRVALHCRESPPGRASGSGAG